ncbi:hypothetical protein RSK20926_00260 [Roseobacter sp. SK209-2-6]|nr:hypothetical protein RSK20926_00260 [Roseobacter sp. SK209-2-6]
MVGDLLKPIGAWPKKWAAELTSVKADLAKEELK